MDFFDDCYGDPFTEAGKPPPTCKKHNQVGYICLQCIEEDKEKYALEKQIEILNDIEFEPKQPSIMLLDILNKRNDLKSQLKKYQ